MKRGRISNSVSYECTTQALVTSIRDLSEHEEGKSLQRRNKRGFHHRRQLYRTSPKPVDSEAIEDEETEAYFQDEHSNESLVEALETLLEKAKFGRRPQGCKEAVD